MVELKTPLNLTHYQFSSLAAALHSNFYCSPFGYIEKAMRFWKKIVITRVLGTQLFYLFFYFSISHFYLTYSWKIRKKMVFPSKVLLIKRVPILSGWGVKPHQSHCATHFRIPYIKISQYFCNKWDIKSP